MFKPEEPSEILIQEYVFFMLRKSSYFQVKAIDLSVNIIQYFTTYTKVDCPSGRCTLNRYLAYISIDT